MISLQPILEAAVAEGCAPGLAAAVITRSGERVHAAAGVREAGAAGAMSADTVFWIASCTKAVTSVAAMQLVERGLIDLDAPVGRFLPLLAAPRVLAGFDAGGEPILRPAARPITLRHLLTHTSGLAYPFFSVELSRYLAAAGQTPAFDAPADYPLLFDPGEGWQYGVSTDFVGQLVEAVSGEPLEAFITAHILAPLGMADTAFFPPKAWAPRRAAFHRRGENGGFEATAFPLPDAPYPAMGGGGLFSTVDDYLTFLTAILAGGEAPGGARILQRQSVALMGSNQTGDLAAGALKTVLPALSLDYTPLPGTPTRFGLGFLRNETPGPAGRSAGSLAWAGIANGYYWADPDQGVAGVLFAQLFPFADPAVMATFEAIERAVYFG